MDGWEWKWLQRNATKLKNLEYTIWGTKIVTQTLNKPCLHDIVFPNEKMTYGMEKPEGWQNQLDGKTSKTIPRDEHVSGMRRPARWQYPRGENTRRMRRLRDEKTLGMRSPARWEDLQHEEDRRMKMRRMKIPYLMRDPRRLWHFAFFWMIQLGPSRNLGKQLPFVTWHRSTVHQFLGGQ